MVRVKWMFGKMGGWGEIDGLSVIGGRTELDGSG